MDTNVIPLAHLAYYNLHKIDPTLSTTIVIVDYTIDSNKPRMFIYGDGYTRNLLVAQGQGGFSNKAGSHSSSIGVYITAYHYQGKHGTSIALKGLESTNYNAENRAIRIHGAVYVRPGKVGHSWGCLAIDNRISEEVISSIPDNSLVFVYYNDSRWLSTSRFLKE